MTRGYTTHGKAYCWGALAIVDDLPDHMVPTKVRANSNGCTASLGAAPCLALDARRLTWGVVWR